MYTQKGIADPLTLVLVGTLMVWIVTQLVTGLPAAWVSTTAVEKVDENGVCVEVQVTETDTEPCSWLKEHPRDDIRIEKIHR